MGRDGEIESSFSTTRLPKDFTTLSNLTRGSPGARQRSQNSRSSINPFTRRSSQRTPAAEISDITRKKTPVSVIGSVYWKVSEPITLAVCMSSATPMAERIGVSLKSAIR